MRRRFVRWYMGRIAGRYCPCEWPIKVKWLIRICGRIDDANNNEDFKDFVALYLTNINTTTTTSTNSDTTFTTTFFKDSSPA